MMRQGPSLRGPSVASQGGTMEIESGAFGSSVEVGVAGGSSSTSHTVGPDGKVSIPVPPVPGGTLLAITVGKGARMRILLIEVVSPFE